MTILNLLNHGVERIVTSRDPLASYLPTLIVDAGGTIAKQLADQLTQSSFRADAATGASAVISANPGRHYGTIVVVGDLNQAEVVDRLKELRRQSSRVWIIAISSVSAAANQERALRYVIDAVLLTPFSMNDLISRLLAFAPRSRPP